MKAWVLSRPNPRAKHPRIMVRRVSVEFIGANSGWAQIRYVNGLLTWTRFAQLATTRERFAHKWALLMGRPISRRPLPAKCEVPKATTSLPGRSVAQDAIQEAGSVGTGGDHSPNTQATGR